MLEYDKMYLIVSKKRNLKREFLEYYVGFVNNENEVEYGICLFEDLRTIYLSKDDLDLYDISEITSMNDFVISLKELIEKYDNAYDNVLDNFFKERGLE